MRKRLIILSTVLFGSINFASAQITFQKTYGSAVSDQGQSGQQTTDGGYILTGAIFDSTSGNYDVYLIKTDANGDTLWTKTYGGTDDDYGFAVQQTTDSGYIIVGSTSSFGAGNFDTYLIRTDVNGNSLWTKFFSGTVAFFGQTVQQTMDGGYIIAENTNSFGAGSYDVYLIKADPNGNPSWIRTLGSTGYEKANSVKQTTDGGYIIAGYTSSFGAGSNDIYLVKVDSGGTLLWTKTLGGTADDRGYSIQQTTDGGFIITGYTNSFGAGNIDVYLIKADANGNLIWAKTFGGIGNDYGYSVQQTSDAGYIVTGSSNSFGSGNNNVYLIKTDANGDSLWIKTFGGIFDAGGYSVQQTNDGGYIITGIGSGFSGGDPDVYLIKTDNNGNSGCYEGNTSTIVTTPATLVASAVTTITWPPVYVTVPVTIVGSGGAVNTPCTTVSINEITTANSFLISPNPSAGNFTISFERTIMKGTVEISNILGENVYAENIVNESRKKINLNNAAAGIYFVKVFVYPDSTGNGEKYYCRKVIVEHD